MVLELLVAQPLSRLVLVVGERGEQVLLLGVAPPLRDHGLQAVADGGQRLARAHVAREGNGERNRRQATREVLEVLQADVHRLVEFVRLVGEVHVEQRLADDAHRQQRHLLGDVDDAAVGPALHHLRGVVHHRRSELADVAGREGMRHQLALLPVHIRVKEEQAVLPHQRNDGLDELAAPEVVRLRRQHLVGQLGRGDERDAHGADLEGADLRTLAADALEELQPIVPEVVEASEKGRSANLGDLLGGGDVH